MSLAGNIKIRREELGLTIIELSRAAGISVRSIERYESGEIIVPKMNLRKIASVLDISEEDLKKEKEYHKKAIEDVQEEKQENIAEDKAQMEEKIEIKSVKYEDSDFKAFENDEDEILSKYRYLDDIGKERVKKVLNSQVKRCTINKL